MWKYVIGGLVVAGILYAAYSWAFDRGAKSRQPEIDRVVNEHNKQVAAADRERAELTEKNRRVEAERDEANRKLDEERKARDEERRNRVAAAADAQRMRDNAATDYLARQADRASKDAASSERIAAETIAMFRQLHRESDEAAGESAGEADRISDQLIGLQKYVEQICLRPRPLRTGP